MIKTTIKIPLDFAVKVDGIEVSELTLHRAKVIDQLNAQKIAEGPAEVELHLFASLCRVPADSIKELDLLDYKKLQDGYVSFLGG
jgi:hypothetical protein